MDFWVPGSGMISLMSVRGSRVLDFYEEANMPMNEHRSDQENQTENDISDDESHHLHSPYPTRTTPIPEAIPEASPLLLCTQSARSILLLRVRQIVGSIMHLALYMRPALVYPVSKLGKFNSNPAITHLRAAKHVLRYIRGTLDHKITYDGPLNSNSNRKPIGRFRS